MEFINSCRIDQYHMVSKLCGIGQYHMFCKPHMFFTIFHWKTSWRFSKTWRIDQYHMFCKTCGIGQYHMFDEKSCFTMGYIVKSHKLYRNADPIQFKKLDWKIHHDSREWNQSYTRPKAECWIGFTRVKSDGFSNPTFWTGWE